jgi:large subunit ribosomal protein L23
MLKPLISEKTINHADHGKFSFILTSPMTKVAIAEFIHKAFSVDVTSVATFNRKGKVKRTAKTMGKRKDRQIAIVTLKKGQKIEGFSIAAPETEKANPDVTVKTKTSPKKKEVAK